MERANFLRRGMVYCVLGIDVLLRKVDLIFVINYV